MAYVLVADDEPDIRELVELALSYDGHTIDTAGDGVEAVDLINRHPYDAVVLDVGMPRMSGIEVATCVVQGGTVNRPRIVMLSAYGGLPDQRRGYDAGADAYLVKGTPMRELRRTVNEVVHQPAELPNNH